MRFVVAIAAGLALVAPAAGKERHGGETITYRSGACFGACPIYTITLGPDGQGIFDGERFTAVRGEHRFQATREQVKAFAKRLNEVRPRGNRTITMQDRDCEKARTDAPTIAVRWQGVSGSTSISAYGGCGGGRGRETYDALRRAPEALPIAGLIGHR